jgi:hypothetical protein
LNLVHVRQVLGKHRVLVVAGIVVSVAAAFFVYAKPGWDGGRPTMTARTPEEWRASSVLFLTQQGFPAGRAVASANDPSGDQSRFSNLAVLYSELATSDRVRAIAEKSGKISRQVVAEPVIYTIGQYATPVVLPMVQISVTAPTAAQAVREAERMSRALQEYVTSGQLGAKIRPKNRVLLTQSRSATDPLMISGPSKAVPIVIFALLLGLTFMIVFAYDNYRSNAESRSVADDGASLASPSVQEPMSPQPTPAPFAQTQAEGVKAAPRRPRAVLSAEPAAEAQSGGGAEVRAVRQPRPR